jgi:hypothetical protein
MVFFQAVYVCTLLCSFCDSHGVSYVCAVFNICCEYLELAALLRVASMWSLYQMLNVLPDCPACFNDQSKDCNYTGPTCHILQKY